MDKETVRAAALELYEAPFTCANGYIFDAKGRMVADNGEQDIVARIRGWGRISYLDNAEALQDEVAEIVAEALTEFWTKHRNAK